MPLGDIHPNFLPWWSPRQPDQMHLFSSDNENITPISFERTAQFREKKDHE
jgi:hypothetical protein